MAVLLACQDLTKAFDRRPLFADTSFGVDDGDRIGLIGPNGAGKSTFLKVLAGLEAPDAGTVALRRGARVAYVPQEDSFPVGATALEVVAAAVDRRVEAHERDTRAHVTLGKAGFEDAEIPVERLSGGWRRRLSIARGLVDEPELLLLDEPTNHLDLEGILWLEDLLRSARFASVCVTHDRYFLDAVCTRIVELSRAYAGGIFRVDGDYEKFLGRRADFLDTQAQEERALAGKVRRDIQWLKRGAKAQRCQPKSIQEGAAERQAELVELRARNAPVGGAGIDFVATGRQTVKLVAAKGIGKALGGRPLFRNLDVTLSPGMRLGLIGPNGSGKTTLLRVLTGGLEPDAGTVTLADRLQVVTFTQHRADLDLDLTLREALSPGSDELFWQGRKIHVTSWARRFLFSPDRLIQRVRELSGGEQARIRISRLMQQSADVLVLDEPTNDLDIDSLEVLEESLEGFPGALVLVTHDRFMLERLATGILALDGFGGARHFADLSQWEAAGRRARALEATAPPPRRTGGSREAAAEAAPAAKLTYQEKRELETIEETILAAEAEERRLEAEAADPGIQHDYVRLGAAHKAFDAARERVRVLYQRWEDLEARRQSGKS